MEMETRAREDIGISQDITHPLPPLAFALHDCLLSSRCSACFAAASITATTPFVVYCSSECTAADSSLHFSSAEHHLFLLLHRHSSWRHGESSDLRASLRLLHRIELLNLLTPLPHLSGRIAGLMTNRDVLTSRSVDEDDLARIKDGARAMAMARAMRDGREFDGDCELEEAVMCIVLTNAVEVQIGSAKALGIAVYDGRFSWINHCCSPNACYRFRLCSGNLKSSNSPSLKIKPANQGIQIDDDSAYNMCELARECSNGPRLVVRSIKVMKKGDEVTVTYTDLMQPRMLRQSDLWCKYRFLCNCVRCSGALSYVDHSLQETIPVDQHLDRDRFSEEMRDYFDTVISDYMSNGNPQSCCENLENLLVEKPTAVDFRLSPIHHLSLSAYTALTSAYRIQSSLVENTSKSFHLSRISTAYSLFLAGATHHLFTFEPSLIVHAAKFWTNAGESLVRFAQFLRSPTPLNRSLVCDDCLLPNKFEANLPCCASDHEELNKVSQHFLNCMERIGPNVWNFLVQDCYYLTQIEDPVNFSWLETLRASNVRRSHTRPIGNVSDDEMKRNIFLLGAHCLVYGCYLSGVCYGQDLSADDYFKNILQG